MKNAKNSTAPILSLSFSDIKHEWALNSILIISIASIIAPLLIIMGLKYGLIKYWTDTLVQDPINRQITPLTQETETEFSDNWIESYSQREDVKFIVPMIRTASSNISVTPEGENRARLLDLYPTNEGDELLLENGGLIPKEGEAVITTAAAEHFGLKMGQIIDAKITRRLKGQNENVTEKLKIISILSPRAGTLPRLYATQKFVSDVEVYKDGGAVQERTWDGINALPQIVMDGIYIVLNNSLTKAEETQLTIRTGFSSITNMEIENINDKYDFKLDQQKVAYKLSVFKKPAGIDSYFLIKKKLRGKKNILLPYVNGIIVKDVQTGNEIKYAALSLDRDVSDKLNIPHLPWGDISDKRNFEDISLALSKTRNINGITVPVKDNNTISLPITNFTGGHSDITIIPFELAGILRTGTLRNIEFDENNNTITKSRSGYYGFRMYANSIDDVLKIADDLRDEGIQTNTAADSISRVKLIDRGLTKMFWLVAIVGIIGGLTSLISSFFASVKRKEKDLGIMRLIGITSNQIFRFPIYQSLFISCASVLVAITAYASLAMIINRVFSKDLPVGQNICYMPPEYLISAGLITIGASVFSSLIAAYQATKIDPSDAIRDE